MASGKRTHLTVFGDDYDTPDGTCIIDFIHVMDLAEAHVAALDFSNNMQADLEVFNVGTGKGNSVLELIKTFEDVNNLKLSYTIEKRRPGDIEAIFTDIKKIESKLGWKAKRSISTSLVHSWNWELINSIK
jgi:UDP-glucose 4-epimerase